MLKLNNTRKIILVSFLTISSYSFSQKIVTKGDRYFYQNQYQEAIKYYTDDLTSKNKKTAEYSLQKLADCYRITGEFEKAEETYKKILKKKKLEPNNLLNYGLALKSSAKYEEAKLQIEEYIKLKPDDQMGPIYLRSCDSAQKWLDETIGKEVKNLEKINTEFSEFSPIVLNNKLYFSSSRTGSKQAFISFDGGGDIHRMDLYNIDLEKVNSKDIDKNEILNFKEINSPMHEGSACFSKDGNELYFTKTVKGSRDEKTNAVLSTLQIFYSKIDSTGKWTKPASLFIFNSLKYSIAHPCLSPDEKTLYFMSDMPGGKGKTDIYACSKLPKGKWGTPRNLGDEVNTFGHELFPYISENGDLYFSSNAHPGMGQLDVFKASYINEKWTNVTNLKPPINSIGNDFGIYLIGKDYKGFVSSDRFNGKGAEDIYSFSDEIPVEYQICNDILKFKDNSIFDDLKYKISNEDDKSEYEPIVVNGYYYFDISKINNFKITSRKNGLSYNKVIINKNTIGDNYQLKINSSQKPIKITGCKKMLKEDFLDSYEVKFIDSTNNQSKNIYLNEKGFFKTIDTIQPKNNYYIGITSKDYVNTDTVKNNTISYTGIIKHNNIKITGARVEFIRNNKSETIIETDSEGFFMMRFNIIPQEKYEFKIITDNYKTKIVHLILEENKFNYLEEIELEKL